VNDALVLEAIDLGKCYPTPRGELVVLRGLSLGLRRGSLTAIVGASGVGKSTLLHVLGTLDRPTAGRVLYEGRDLFRLPAREVAGIRNRSVGFVFQFHHLLPEFTALENVMMPGLISRRGIDGVYAQAAGLLARVGLAERGDHRPAELSGGEQQRVAVARALMNQPLVLLADEPSGNLDRTSADALHELLLELVRETGQTTLVATHDERLAVRADEVYRLESGTLHLVRGSADNRPGGTPEDAREPRS
jgi:lipoprotein-releasing system ATP-binding protein